jgi:hypothetical protein
MSLSREPSSAQGAAGPLRGRRGDLGTVSRPRSRMPARLVIGVVSALLLLETAIHLMPALRAGLHDGTHGLWVATTKRCVRSACSWSGKFVSPNGHVLASSAQYDGRLPAGIHAGTSVAGQFTGSGLVFPVSGSDLWISMLVALGVCALGLYWSSHRFVRSYFQQRRATNPVVRP